MFNSNGSLLLDKIRAICRILVMCACWCVIHPTGVSAQDTENPDRDRALNTGSDNSGIPSGEKGHAPDDTGDGHVDESAAHENVELAAERLESTGLEPLAPVEEKTREEAANDKLNEAVNIDLKEVVTEPLETERQNTLDTEGLADGTGAEDSVEEHPDILPRVLTTPDQNVKPNAQNVSEEVPQASSSAPQPALKLLKAEVKPGTSTRLAWEPKVAFMGISVPTAVLVVNGVRQGPTLCLTAAVHGDELNGIEVVRHILYNAVPDQLAGAIIGVPIVNLQGFRRSSRYLPDRRDLNRYFPGNPRGSAAARIAHSFFEEVIRHCSYLVDVHTGSFRRTNLPQLRADLAYKPVASLTEMMGAIVVVQSKGHPRSLRRAAVEAGVPSVTLEAGEPHILQKPAVEQSIKSIQTLMHALGMAKTLNFWELRKEPVYYKSRWVRATVGGILFSEVKLGDYITVGAVLGTVTDPITNLSTDIVSPYNGRVIGMALNQVMYPGFAAYHIGLRTPAESAAEADDDLSEEGAGGTPQTNQQPEEESESVSEMEMLEDS